MPTKNGLKYPDTPAGLATCKQKWFKDEFNSYWKSQLTTNDKTFLKQAKTAKGFKVLEVMSEYILTGGSPKVSIAAADLAKLKKADKALRDGKNYAKTINEATAMVEAEAKRVALGKFFKSPAFEKGHRQAVYNSIKPNKQMATVTKIPDMKALKDFMFHLKMGENKAAEKIAEKYSKADDMKKNGKALVSKLMKANGMT
jgi:competence protein ComGF